MTEVLQKIQVNIPFTMLYESYLPRIMDYGINPEIGFDADALDRFSMSDFKDIAGQILHRGLSITLHSPFMDLSPGSTDPDVRALTRHRFQQVSQLVPIFQPKTVVCHTGWDWKRYWAFKDSWIHYSRELWSWFAEDIGKEGSILVFENVYEHDPYEFMGLINDLKDQGIGCCLDTGHQFVFSTVSISEWLKTMGPDIIQLHLHDNHGTRDDHLALGKGKIDFGVLFRYLKNRREPPPIITLEPHREEDLWPSLEYLQQIWPW